MDSSFDRRRHAEPTAVMEIGPASLYAASAALLNLFGVLARYFERG